MAAMARVGLLTRSILSNRAVVTAPAVRYYWNKDWMPGPYPITPREREAAAKKYGLRPEDYEPFPDDGTGHGDYPNLPLKSIEGRSYYDDWDYGDYRRNYGEPLPYDIDMIMEDKVHVDVPFRYTWFQMFLMAAGIMGFITFMYIIGAPYPAAPKRLPKQYPHRGDAHYTFEPAE